MIDRARNENRFSTDAYIDKDGNLKLYTGEFHEWLKRWSDRKVVLSLEIANGTQDWQRKYYFGYVVKEMRRALHSNGNRFTLKETDEFLRSRSIYCLHEELDENFEYRSRVLGISELDEWKMSCFLEELKEVGAEYGVYIEDPDRFNLFNWIK